MNEKRTSQFKKSKYATLVDYGGEPEVVQYPGKTKRLGVYT